MNLLCSECQSSRQHDDGRGSITVGLHELDCSLNSTNNNQRTALLTKLREEVEGLKCEPYYGAPNDRNQTLDEVLALLEKAGE